MQPKILGRRSNSTHMIKKMARISGMILCLIWRLVGRRFVVGGGGGVVEPKRQEAMATTSSRTWIVDD